MKVVEPRHFHILAYDPKLIYWSEGNLQRGLKVISDLSSCVVLTVILKKEQ